MQKMKNLIIVGTGLAGYALAKKFRQYDQVTSLTLITKSDGGFYSKPLLSTALTHHKTPNQLLIADVDMLRKQLHATILTRCHVFRIDAENKKLFYQDEHCCEHILMYDKLVLAFGSEKISTAFEGSAVKDILSVNQLEDYHFFRDQLKEKKDVAILGAGLVGCEFANDLANAGYTVKLITRDRYLLSKQIPESMSRAFEKALSQWGVQFYNTAFPTTLNRKGADIELVLSDGKMVTAALVLSAIGIKPDLTLAKTAHLKINAGIVVNTSLQTSNPDIFALGECAEIFGHLTMHVTPILQCAHVLAKVLVGDKQSVNFAVTPIIIKTPACPMVVVAPPKNCVGEWKTISSENINIASLFYDEMNQLQGFALSGDAVKEKDRLTALMSG